MQSRVDQLSDGGVYSIWHLVWVPHCRGVLDAVPMSGAVMLFCFINVGSKETYEKADSPQTMRNPPPDLHLLLAVFLPIVSLAAGQGPVLPLENSPIVSKSADGSLVVADKLAPRSPASNSPNTTPSSIPQSRRHFRRRHPPRLYRASGHLAL